MNQHVVSRIAIYVLAIVMIIFGIQHFRFPYDFLIKVPHFIPGGMVWVYVVGVAFILAGISFLTNRLVRVSAYLLAVLLFSFVLTIHLPNFLDTADREYARMALSNALKDSALAAFSLYIASNARHQHILEDVDVRDNAEAREQVEVS